MLIVENEGMPFVGEPFTRGKLFVKFDVTFPENRAFDPGQVQMLAALLSPTIKLKEDVKSSDDVNQGKDATTAALGDIDVKQEEDSVESVHLSEFLDGTAEAFGMSNVDGDGHDDACDSDSDDGGGTHGVDESGRDGGGGVPECAYQ